MSTWILSVGCGPTMSAAVRNRETYLVKTATSVFLEMVVSVPPWLLETSSMLESHKTAEAEICHLHSQGNTWKVVGLEFSLLDRNQAIVSTTSKQT